MRPGHGTWGGGLARGTRGVARRRELGGRGGTGTREGVRGTELGAVVWRGELGAWLGAGNSGEGAGRELGEGVRGTELGAVVWRGELGAWLGAGNSGEGAGRELGEGVRGTNSGWRFGAGNSGKGSGSGTQGWRPASKTNMRTLWDDVRFGLRLLASRPLHSAALVAVLALGIGATTAIFSVVNVVVLNSLPFPSPERIFEIQGSGEEPYEHLSPTEFAAWRERSRVFSTVAASRSDHFVILSGVGQPEHLFGERISKECLPLLGTAPLLGRWLSEEEFGKRSAPAVVIGEALWQRQFGRDPRIIGKSVTLDGVAHTVVGVMPAAFRFRGFRREVWRPLQISQEDQASPDARFLSVIGRLKPGATLEEAKTEGRYLSGRPGAEVSCDAQELERRLRTTSRHGARRGPDTGAGALRRGGVCAADRLRERGEFAARSRGGTEEGDVDPRGARRGTRARHPPVADGKPAARDDRRRGGSGGGAVERARAGCAAGGAS